MCGRGLLAVLGLALAAANAAATPNGETAERGRAISHGETALTAHLRGDTRPLPAFTLRCANCHTQTVGATALAPPLSARYLLDAIPRRGGPPTRYDRDAFCKVLASSIDPAAVMLASSMPQYVLSDDECTALWGYFLTQ